MSLLSRIQSNTQSVSDGKYSLVTAIMGKGGDVPLTSNLPTFNQLVQGVESIPEGSEEVVASRGAVHVEALARENIQQYDSVKVLASSGNTTFVGNDLLPTIARYNADGTETTVDVHFYSIKQAVYGISYISETGRFIVLGNFTSTGTISGSIGLYPFYLTNGTYKQLKIDGVYKPFPAYIGATYNLNGHYNSNSYYGKIPISADEINSKIATSYPSYITLYDLDIENLNIISSRNLIPNYTSVHSLILKNKTIFVENFVGGSTTANDRYTIMYGNIQEDNDNINLVTFASASTYRAAAKIGAYGTSISDNSFYLISTVGSDATYSKMYKFRLDTDNNEYKLVKKQDLPIKAYVGQSLSMNASATKLFIKNYQSAAIKVYLINDVNDNITFTDVTSENFIDSTDVFDPSSVTEFTASRGGRYLLALKRDTSLSYADRLVMLEYQFEDKEQGTPSGYKVISYPLKDWIPTVIQDGTYPLLNESYFFNSDKYMICQTSVGTSKIYESYSSGTGYYMQKTSNLLSNEVNLYGYGIATKDVMNGQVGDASLNVINVF